MRSSLLRRALKFQNFLGEHAPKPHLRKGTNSPLLIQSVTLFKPAGYFSNYVIVEPQPVFCKTIGYMSKHNGPILSTCICLFCPESKDFVLSLNKYFIDQTCSVKMAKYWLRASFVFIMDLDIVSVHAIEKWNLASFQSS